MSIPIPSFSLPFPPLTVRLFSTSVTQFLFCKEVHLYHSCRFHIQVLLYDVCLSDICQAIWLDWAWRHWFWAVRLAQDKGSKVFIITWHSIQEEEMSPVLSKIFMARQTPELQRPRRSLWGGHCYWRMGLTDEDPDSRLVALLHVCCLHPGSRLKPSSKEANSKTV